jgi:hypothetical protein
MRAFAAGVMVGVLLAAAAVSATAADVVVTYRTEPAGAQIARPGQVFGLAPVKVKYPMPIGDVHCVSCTRMVRST